MGATGASQPNTVASLRPRAVELIPDADSENKAWAHRIWRDVQSVASGNLAEKTIWNQVRRAGRAPKDKRRARYSYPSRIFYCGPRARVSPSGRPPPQIMVGWLALSLFIELVLLPVASWMALVTYEAHMKVGCARHTRTLKDRCCIRCSHPSRIFHSRWPDPCARRTRWRCSRSSSSKSSASCAA